MSRQPDDSRLLRLNLDTVALTLTQLTRIEQIFAGLLGEVGAAVVDGDPQSVQWLVQAVSSGSIRFELRPEPVTKTIPHARMSEVVHAVADGLALLERHAERPPFFTDRALERASDLVDQIGRGVRAIEVGNAKAKVSLTPNLKVNVADVLRRGGLVDSIGTIEGRLETVSVHERRYFNVYDDLTGERIECRFGGDLELADVGRAVGRRVAVTGKITYRASGEIVMVEAEQFYVFPEPESLPSAEDVRGLLADR